MCVTFCVGNAFATEEKIFNFPLGTPKQKFEYFPHVNPNAPKSGELRLFSLGSFDTMNPFAMHGSLASGGQLTHDSLMAVSPIPPFTLHPLIAEYAVLNAQELWIDFYIHPKAQFHDKTPITSRDVVFSYTSMMQNLENGIQQFFQDIMSAEVKNSTVVRFKLAENFSENALAYISMLPIHSQNFWKTQDISKAYLGKILGSGPYELATVSQGVRIQYNAVDNYWAKDLPFNKGRYNFEKISYEYYRDGAVALEAFRAGHYDVREEFSYAKWQHEYVGQAFTDKQIIRGSYENMDKYPIEGIFFNIRHSFFKNKEVRRAIALVYDFEWTNKSFFGGMQKRMQSYYNQSSYQAPTLPTPEEIAFLSPMQAYFSPEILKTPLALPVSDTLGYNRSNIIKSAAILKDQGFIMRDGVLFDEQTDKPFVFEILVRNSNVRKILIPFIQNLRKLGIEARIRTVDSAQNIYKLNTYDFDTVVRGMGFSGKPGLEQRLYWHSENINLQGGNNLVGANNPALDYCVESLLAAKTEKEKMVIAQALDRLLMWEYYVIPFGISTQNYVAYSSHLVLPVPLESLGFLDIYSWWGQAK